MDRETTESFTTQHEELKKKKKFLKHTLMHKFIVLFANTCNKFTEKLSEKQANMKVVLSQLVFCDGITMNV